MSDTLPRLNRLDESYVNRVEEILEGDTDKVPVKVQIGLMLAMQSQLLRGMNGLIDRVEIANGRTSKNESEIDKLKSKNIIMWMDKNPRAAIIVTVLTILFIDLLVDTMDSANTLTVLIAFFKKWLGV